MCFFTKTRLLIKVVLLQFFPLFCVNSLLVNDAFSRTDDIHRKFHIYVDVSETVSKGGSGVYSGNSASNIKHMLKEFVGDITEIVKYDENQDSIYCSIFANDVLPGNVHGLDDRESKVTNDIVNGIFNKISDIKKIQKNDGEISGVTTNLANLFEKIYSKIHAIPETFPGKKRHVHYFIVVSDFLNSGVANQPCDFYPSPERLSGYDMETSVSVLELETKVRIENSINDLLYEVLKRKDIYLVPFRLGLNDAKQSQCNEYSQEMERMLWQPLKNVIPKKHIVVNYHPLKKGGFARDKGDFKRFEKKIRSLITKWVRLSVDNSKLDGSKDNCFPVRIGIENPNDSGVNITNIKIEADDRNDKLNTVNRKEDFQFRIKAKGERHKTLYFNKETLEELNRGNKPLVGKVYVEQVDKPVEKDFKPIWFSLPPLIPEFEQHSLILRDRPLKIKYDFSKDVNYFNEAGYPGGAEEYFRINSDCFDFSISNKFKGKIDYELTDYKSLFIEFKGDINLYSDKIKIQVGRYSIGKKISQCNDPDNFLALIYDENIPTDKVDKTFFALAFIMIFLPFVIMVVFNELYSQVEQSHFFSIYIIPCIFGLISMLDKFQSVPGTKLSFYIIGFLPLCTIGYFFLMVFFNRRHVLREVYLTSNPKQTRVSSVRALFFYFFAPHSGMGDRLRILFLLAVMAITFSVVRVYFWYVERI